MAYLDLKHFLHGVGDAGLGRVGFAYTLIPSFLVFSFFRSAWSFGCKFIQIVIHKCSFVRLRKPT
jgi:hypothetical protein